MRVPWDPSLLRRMVWVGAALTVVAAYGTVGYVVLEGWSFLDALYMTITTMTTVGFREVRELDTGGRLFTLTVVVLGGGAALIGVSLLAAAIAEADLTGVTRRRRMAKRIEELEHHYIVCAYGRVGRAAVRELQAARVPFVVIDPQEGLRGRMERDGIPFMIDDPSLEPVLRRARIEAARGLICAVDSDATNVFITLAARALNPRLFIVARASEPGSQERLERAGADRIVSPYASSGRHMVQMAIDPAILDPFSDEEARRTAILVEERRIHAPSELVGRQVGELDGSVLAIRRSDGRVHANPPADLVLEEGDVVLVLGPDAT
ncbi:MAG TPA: potassium channel protein [Actinomycetota bacterium]|nr:potassium channel protein [Actinomycetota bacterium]